MIHLIDKQRGIAIFETIEEGEKARYRLMVAANTAKTFPLIVHQCKTQKAMEYEFPTPDFEKLLKSKGKNKSPKTH